MRTAYSYDSAGRLEYETITREAGGTTNLYKTQYAYSWIAAASGGGRQLVRTEQAYSGGAWANDNKLTYKHDALEREYFEERHDWAAGAWSSRFDTTQEYDKNGNRTRYHRNLGLGQATNYGRAEDLSYTFNNVNQLTAIADADAATYAATITCDANGNITQIEEAEGPTDVNLGKNKLYTYFEYDDLNRLLVHKDKRYVAGGTNAWVWVKRSHAWDAVGRLVHSNRKIWNDVSQEPAGDSLEHTYAGARHLQSYDGTSAYGAVWHWAGAEDELAAPLRSPNADTASQNGYNLSDAYTPQRRTFLNPTTEGNKREFFAQGRPEAKDSSGGGANWYLGTQSQPQGGTQGTVESRLFFEGTVAATDMSRATDARQGYRMGVFGTGHAYYGSSGRVVSEPLGRDLNPLGRGDGMAYLAGQLRSGWLAPELPLSMAVSGTGNTINNDGAMVLGGGGGDTTKFTCCNNACCTGLIVCVNGPNSIGPVPEPCPPPCTDDECRATPQLCFYKCCKRIACGCSGPGCRIVDSDGDNCKLFCRCGCCKYGGCLPSSGFCNKGQMIGANNCPSGGGCSGASGSGPGGNGGALLQTPPPPLSPNFNIQCNQKYTPLVQQALQMVLNAVSSGCITNNCAALNGSTNNLRDCVLDILNNLGLTIKCRWWGGGGRTSHASSNQIDIWISRILAVCKQVLAEDIATAILHELIHVCQIRNKSNPSVAGLAGVSCCDDGSDGIEALAYLCQVKCFPSTCLSKNVLQNSPTLAAGPKSCCGECK